MPARPRKAAAPKAAPAVPDFEALLAGARLPESSLPVCLRADLQADHEKADRELEALLKKPALKMSGDGRGELRQRILDLEAEMKAWTYEFRLRALPKRQWRALVAAHPPRKGPDGEIVPGDGPGINSETFYSAMIRACTIDPVLTEDQWRALIGDTPEEAAEREAQGLPVEDGKLTDRQFDEIANAAWDLNRRDIDIPFSRAASRLNQSSDSE
jgi:hypothetical protein